MHQLALFTSAEVVLTDDSRGRMTYLPTLVEAAVAGEWFHALRTSVAWRAERRMMYDREVDVPRLVAHFRLDAIPDSLPAAIREALCAVRERVAAPFNGVGLNLYRDGLDSVAPHNDHLYELQEGYPIGLVSLGATRRMTIRAKRAPRRVMHLDLEAGSLLVMDYATQLHYTHGVPKTEEAVGERISLAFRVRPPAAIHSSRSGRDVYR